MLKNLLANLLGVSGDLETLHLGIWIFLSEGGTTNLKIVLKLNFN